MLVFITFLDFEFTTFRKHKLGSSTIGQIGKTNIPNLKNSSKSSKSKITRISHILIDYWTIVSGTRKKRSTSGILISEKTVHW